jgi:predicted RNA binding protein YcfA (HicA-like mRNA interferase family)
MTRMPQVTAQGLLRFLKSQGFEEDRRSGSHPTPRHPARRIAVTVAVHTGADIGRGLAATIRTDAGFAAEEFARRR